MANIIIGYNNLANNSTLSGGSWQSTLPVNNLKDRRLYKLARSTDATNASTKFDVDIGSDTYIKVFALVKHNFSFDATARLRGYTDSGYTTLAYDSGAASVWPVTDSLALEWEDTNFWFGIPSVEQINMFQGITLWVVPNTLARYWRVEIFDSTNTDGYVDIGRLFISKDFSPSVNASYGLNFGVIDKSEIEESLGGVEHYDNKAKVRTVDFSLESLNDDEAFARWFRMMLGQGNTGEVLFIYDYEDSEYTLDRSFLGRISQSNPLTTPYFATWTSGATIKETI